MQFQVGDRVRQVETIDGSFGAIGAIGTVVRVDRAGMLTIEFDEDVPGGHNCHGVCAYGRGLWVTDHNSLVLIGGHGRTCGAGSFGEFVRKQERLVAEMHPGPA